MAGRVVSAVFDTITVLFLALFVLLEMPAITDSLLSLLSPPQAERARTIGVEINSTVARYVAGNFAISLIAGVVTYVTPDASWACRSPSCWRCWSRSST